MQVALLDYWLGQVTILDIPKELIEQEDFDINEYMESLPGVDISCTWMSSDKPITIRTGKPSDFPDLNG